MDKELINRLEEALEFWTSLADKIPLEKAIKSLKERLKAAKEAKDDGNNS